MTQSRLIKFLWCVIAVLVVGLAAVTGIALSRAHAIDTARTYENGDVASLREQLKQAKAQATPAGVPLAESTGNLATPTPSAVPKATVKPK